MFEDMLDEMLAEMVNVLEDFGFEDYERVLDDDGQAELEVFCDYLADFEAKALTEEAKSRNLGVDFSADNNDLVITFYYDNQDNNEDTALT